VVEDVEETRRGTEQLLTASGYRVDTARDEDEAVMRASLHAPDLMLVSPGVDAARAVSIARRIRDRAGLRPEVPVVFF
jgi:CheY-like chemotaxis protein